MTPLGVWGGLRLRPVIKQIHTTGGTIDSDGENEDNSLSPPSASQWDEITSVYSRIARHHEKNTRTTKRKAEVPLRICQGTVGSGPSKRPKDTVEVASSASHFPRADWGDSDLDFMQRKWAIQPGLIDIVINPPTAQWDRYQEPLRVDDNETVTIDDDDVGSSESVGFNTALGQEGMISIAEFAKKSEKLVTRKINSFNRFVTEFCNVSKWNPWVFSMKLFQRFAGFMYSKGKNLTLDSYTTAFNYVYALHGLPQQWACPQVVQYKKHYKAAMYAKRNLEGNPPAFMRVELEPQALFLLLDKGEDARDKDEYKNIAMVGFQLIMLLFWLRADSVGAFKAGDLAWDNRGYTTILIRKVKTGQAILKPFTKSIPPPNPVTNNRTMKRVMAFLRMAAACKTTEGEWVLDAATWNIRSDNAASMINRWMTLYMPNELTGVAPASFLSSHSYRRTGASQAWCSCRAHWCQIMRWGGWLTIVSAERYCVRSLGISSLWKELFYFLMPDYDEAGQLDAGPNGWYLPEGMDQPHRPMANVHAQRV